MSDSGTITPNGADAPDAVGFEEPAAMPPSAFGRDDLEAIADNAEMPPVLRVLARRLGRLEHNTPDAMKLAQDYIAAGAKIEQLEKQVMYLSQQRAVAELQMEFHARSVALDLALKTLPEATRGSPEAGDTITTLAGAYLAWLRAAQA